LRLKQKKARVFFSPIGLFNRQIFNASYSGKLLVQENKLIQYSTNLESELYAWGRNRLIEPDINFSLLDSKEDQIKKTLELFGNRFQIDFVTQNGLEDYLKMIEKEVQEISTKKWSFNINKNVK
jgi:hypothetical protein